MTDLPLEQQLRTEIERLRTQFPQTQDLYREACVLLFFRFGITPTANKLYQLVRKGSMSAPAEALAKFWSDLREKSRVRIEHPDLPDILRTSAGDLVAALWGQAQAAAQEGLLALRAEAESSVLEAKSAIEASEASRITALQERDQARRAFEESANRILQLERDLAAERAGKEALSKQLEESQRQQAARDAALADARKDFAGELEKLRNALRKSEERYEAAEKRALLEIDRERLASTRLQKDLAELRQVNAEAAEQYRANQAQLQGELAQARQSLGVAEGTLQEMRATSRQHTDQLDFLRSLAAERGSQISLLQGELEEWRSRVANLKQEVDQYRATYETQRKTSRPRRKDRKSAEGSDSVHAPTKTSPAEGTTKK